MVVTGHEEKKAIGSRAMAASCRVVQDLNDVGESVVGVSRADFLGKDEQVRQNKAR